MKPIFSTRNVGNRPNRTPRAVAVSLHSLASAGNNAHARSAQTVTGQKLSGGNYVAGKLKPQACTNCKHSAQPIHAFIDDNHSVDAGNYHK